MYLVTTYYCFQVKITEPLICVKKLKTKFVPVKNEQEQQTVHLCSQKFPPQSFYTFISFCNYRLLSGRPPLISTEDKMWGNKKKKKGKQEIVMAGIRRRKLLRSYHTRGKKKWKFDFLIVLWALVQSDKTWNLFFFSFWNVFSFIVLRIYVSSHISVCFIFLYKGYVLMWNFLRIERTGQRAVSVLTVLPMGRHLCKTALYLEIYIIQHIPFHSGSH